MPIVPPGSNSQNSNLPSSELPPPLADSCEVTLLLENEEGDHTGRQQIEIQSEIEVPGK